jgi:cystathionine gamma-synthase
LLGRGLKTLALRIDRHNTSGLAIARMLDEHPKVAQVWYPLLASHEDYELGRRYLSGGGGVVSFEVHGGLDAGTRLVDAVAIPKLAPSLGGVESLIEQPALMSFYDQGPEGRAALGIREGLIRLSVGIEDLEDLRADLLAALDQV